LCPIILSDKKDFSKIVINIFIGFFMKKIYLLSVFCCLCFGAFAQSTTYNTAGGSYTVTVPANVTKMSFDVAGAQGGGVSTGVGGMGGRVTGQLTVTPGQVLYIFVGGAGQSYAAGYQGGLSAGGETGGVGGSADGGGGGGAGSDIRTSVAGGATSAGSLGTRLVAGGGGGGAGYYSCAPMNGGAGGDPGVAGGLCNGVAGGGATTTAGGAAGTGGTAGTLGLGGADNGGARQGGGGGGGYYGGGGSARNGGGGGSSYAPGPGIIGVPAYTTGYEAGNGYVTICFWPGVTASASPNPVCVGSALTLTGTSSNGTSYSWTGPTTSDIVSTGSLSTSIAHTALGDAGIYTLVATNACGSTTVTTTAVSVNAAPGAINGNTGTICSTTTLNLTDASGGGTWSSSATTVATIGSTTGVVTGVASGTSIISYTTGCGSAVGTIVTVISTPGAISGSATVCQGLTTSLSDAATGGTWTSTNTSVATVGTSGLVNGVAQGTSVISYTTGCGAGVSLTVSVNDAPSAITGITSVCQGATTTLADVAINGTWTSSSTTVATISSTGMVSGVSGGVSAISYSTGCGAAVGTVVTVTPTPVAISGTTLFCQGSTTSLTDAATGGMWTSINTSVATIGTGGGTVQGVSGGTSTISYTTGCGTAATTVVTVSTPPTAITGPTSVCTGNSITLSNGTNGGIWTSSAPLTASVGSTNGIVNGLLQGTAIISYTTTSCAPATYSITVNPYPSAISGVTQVCLGSSVTLSDITGGGTWSSSLPGTGSVDATSGIVGGMSTGSFTVYYTVLGCAVSQDMTVNPLPAAITGSPIVCLGSTTTLDDATPGGTWASDNSLVASVGSSTGVVYGAALGNTYISYTLTSTLCYVTFQETVDVNPGAISGSTGVCQGATTHLIDGSGGGFWSSSSSATASVGSISGVVTGHILGAFTITYTLPTGCFVTQAMTVNPNPAPITGPVVVCTGASITLSDVTTGGTWSSDEYWIATIGSSSGVVTGVTAGGTTSISYTLGTGCYATYIDSVVAHPSAIMGDSTICVGATSILSDSVGGGAWSSAAPGSLSINSVGLITGNAIALAGVAITYSITGCPAVTFNVTVNPVPQPIVGPSNFCDSIHANLYDFTTGGTWSSQDSVTARIIGTPDSGVVVGVSLGSTTISYTLPTGCYATLAVTVNPLAPPIAGTDTICATGFAWLTDIVDTGTWTSSNPAVASITDSGYLAGLVPGVTFIVYTLPTGCSASLLETVIPPVSSILGPTEVCSGSIADFSDAESGGVWTSTNNYVASVVGSTGVATGAYPGNVIISYTVSSFKGCYTAAALIVNPLPSPTVTYNYATPSVSTNLGYTSYQWYNDRTGIIPGAINATYVLPNYNDSVYVVVTDLNGCTDSSSWFYNAFTGIKNVNNASIRIYPNPASSMLFVDANVAVKAVLTGIDGKTVLEQANAKELNISGLTPGIYMVVLYDDEGRAVLTEKVVKE